MSRVTTFIILVLILLFITFTAIYSSAEAQLQAARPQLLDPNLK